MISRHLLLPFILIFCMHENAFSAGIENPQCRGLSGDKKSIARSMCECTPEYLNTVSAGNNMSKEMEDLKKIQAKADLINGTRKIVDQYKLELSNLAKPAPDAKLPVRLLEYKRAIEDAVLLNSINAFINKNKSLIEEKDFDIKKLCTMRGNQNEYRFLCDYNKNEDHWYSKSYIDTMKRFIEAYKIAQTAGDQKELDAKIQSIINDIPKNNSPEFVLKLEENFSPELKTSMEKVTDEFDDLCPEAKIEGHKGCEPKYLKFTDVTNENIIKEMNNFSSALVNAEQTQNERKLSINNQVQEFIKKNLQEKFKAFESTRKDETSASFNNYIKPRKNFGLADFLQLAEKIKGQYGSDMGFSDHAKDFSNNCIGDNPKKFEALSDYDRTVRMNECNDLLQQMYDTFSDKVVKDVNDELAKAQQAFLTKMNSPETRNIGIIQNFLANNYMRNCTTKNVSVNLIKGCNNDVLSPLSQFKLKDQTFNIIGKISSESEVNSAFTTSELNDIYNICRSKTNYQNFKLMCDSVSNEYEMAKGQKTNKEWSDLHEKYWVNYDESAKGGYTITEKKSMGRMFGEAIVPAITKNLPYALYNYSQSVNIDWMQQQAMMQKQWMWDMNQAQTYWMNNYFYTYTGTPTFTNTNSFNFGK